MDFFERGIESMFLTIIFVGSLVIAFFSALYALFVVGGSVIAFIVAWFRSKPVKNQDDLFEVENMKDDDAQDDLLTVEDISEPK